MITEIKSRIGTKVLLYLNNNLKRRGEVLEVTDESVTIRDAFDNNIHIININYILDMEVAENGTTRESTPTL